MSPLEFLNQQSREQATPRDLILEGLKHAKPQGADQPAAVQQRREDEAERLASAASSPAPRPRPQPPPPPVARPRPGEPWGHWGRGTQ